MGKKRTEITPWDELPQALITYSDDGIVCQSYIPGLERFNLIRNGCHVVPQRFLRQTAKTA